MVTKLDIHETTEEFTGLLLQVRGLKQLAEASYAYLKQHIGSIQEFGIALYDEKKHRFSIVCSAIDGEPVLNEDRYFSDEGDTLPAFLLKSKRPILVNNVEAFEQQSGVDLREHSVQSFDGFVASLIESGKDAFGYCYATSSEVGGLEPTHRDLFERMSGVIALSVQNALAFEELRQLKDKAELEGEYLRAEIGDNWPADGLIGKSRSWKAVLHQVNQVAPTDSTVLIQGETGTGKEVIARAIHERGRRAKKPLIKINCGALPENLVESELFGHERGSFTGAMGKRIGRFELADGGTIFLDEIGEMPLALQVKLLRVLQEREFERVGGEKPIRVNVRVIAATNKDLSAEVAAGRFRADLFYRLNVFPVSVPPLRMRPDDATELAQYFTHRISERMGKRPVVLSDESIQAIQNYSWPGNVRELEHLVERAIILAQSNVADLSALLMPQATLPAFPSADSATAAVANGSPISLKESFQEAEKAAIEAALRECNGVVGGKNGAAARLGLKRQTLQSKMKKLGITLGKPRRTLSQGEEEEEAVAV